jgi:ribose transport system ATP-binding protein
LPLHSPPEWLNSTQRPPATEDAQAGRAGAVSSSERSAARYTVGIESILTAEKVVKRYGGVHALRGARLELRAGEVHALIGENGAGKSTLGRILAGATPADAASIAVAGRPIEIRNPGDAQRLGIVMIHQELDLFPSLTAGDNIVLGNLCFAGGSIERFSRPFLDQVGLSCPAGRPVESLSIAQKQLLAIARALSMNARILLMDEPSSSLFGDAVERLFGLIAGLRERGIAILYVSHKMDEIFRIADRITVLRDGETVGTLDATATSPAEIVRLMVGRDVEMSRPARRAPGRDVVLRVEGLRTRKLAGLSFELRRGEVLGIAGLVGSGRSALGLALAGLDRVTGGTVRGGAVGLLPEDRGSQGLMPDMSVLENSTLAVFGRVARSGFLRRREERRIFQPVARRLALKCASAEAPVSTLSGGNQQKTLLARWLLRNPDVLFLDDPTRGIDVAAKQDIYRAIDELAAAGKGVLLVSSELPELLRCSDRILVLKDGRQTALYDAGEATQETIMAAATGAVAPVEFRAG